MAAVQPPGGVATLIVPQECQWNDSDGPASVVILPTANRVPSETVESVARTLREASAAVLFLGGSALSEQGLHAAARIAAGARCRVLVETHAARREAGSGLPDFQRLPYFPEPALDALASTQALVLAGALDPVTFFGYPNVPSRLAPSDTQVRTLARPEDDAAVALEALADTLAAPAVLTPSSQRPELPTGALSVQTLGQAIAALLPDNAIVVNEAATSGGGFEALSGRAAAHTVLRLTGGAIGQGLPTAVGAAIADPDRQVLAFQADGSGLYTVQSLWTMAREQLDVTVVIAANNAYRILQTELARSGIEEPGPVAQSLTDLTGPVLDWVQIARGFGVPARRTSTAEEFTDALANGFHESGPCLIQAVLGPTMGVDL